MKIQSKNNRNKNKTTEKRGKFVKNPKDFNQEISEINEFIINLKKNFKFSDLNGIVPGKKQIFKEEALVEVKKLNQNMKNWIDETKNYQNLFIKKNTFHNRDKLSISLLMGGIAHDLNNILTTISGNVSLTLSELENFSELDVHSELKENLTSALSATKRATGLTSQLLRFSKGGEPIKKSTSIGDIIIDSTQFILAGSKVKVIYNIPDKLPEIKLDSNQISQVIQNLIFNAKEAMDEFHSGSGTIYISVKEVRDFNKIPKRLNSKSYLKISIKDNGPGIPEIIQKDIIKPYFTTKSTGNGLGLITCFKIIKNHKGRLDFESKEGEGTIFNIYLPISKK